MSRIDPLMKNLVGNVSPDDLAQEILEVLGVYGDPDLKKRQDEVAAQRKKDQNKKPDLATQKARSEEERTKLIKAKRDAIIEMKKVKYKIKRWNQQMKNMNNFLTIY